jgi:hypothetical protein
LHLDSFLMFLHPHFQPHSLHMASRTLDYQFFHLMAYLWSYLSWVLSVSKTFSQAPFRKPSLLALMWVVRYVKLKVDLHPTFELITQSATRSPFDGLNLGPS